MTATTEQKIEQKSEYSFTDSQKTAINTHNKNLLVSAGAGSGKTTVLTQRLIKYIKDEKASVTDFLVVTFMKAAASDIKRKLYDELLKALTNAPEEQQKHLYQQIQLIPEANICTISSYCLSLVKENFSLLGISPKVRVIDETESAMMLRKAADDIIANGYETESAPFLLLSDNFTGDKNDDPLADSMIKLYNTLRVTLNKEEMLKNCAQNLKNEAETTKTKGFFETEMGKDLKIRLKGFYEEYLRTLHSLYEFAESVAEKDSYLVPISKMIDVYEAAYESIDTNYVNFSISAQRACGTIKLASSGCDKEYSKKIGAIKKKIVDAHKKMYERYCRGSEDLIAESLLKSADVVDAINLFITELDVEYSRLKLETSSLDYTDFEQKALALLETVNENGERVPTELCLKKQNTFKEILIDEYQDVNPMQDRLFTLLSGKSHRFMVGDVKQSIYRFRNAYPDIFLGYKSEYSKGGEDDENNCIFLRENFRCAQTVIDYVNYLFESVTTNTPYENEYKGEWLVHASKKKELFHPVVIAVADKEKERGKAAEAKKNEAEYIARTIRELYDNGLSDDGSRFKYSDFAVMMSAMKGYSAEYELAFKRHRIPYKTEVSENFLENPDIRLAISALKAIDDPTDDIALCALMRSPICNFSSNDLYRIRQRLTSTPFWTAVSKTAKIKRKRLSKQRFGYRTRSGERSLSLRCMEFAKRLSVWRYESSGVPCRDFLKSFFVSSGMLRIASSSGNRASLLLLFDYSARYEIASNHGLSGFLDYIAELSNGGKEISDAARVGDEDAVSFITVHKSKGLEFKVCFLAGCEKRFMGVKSNEITVLRGEGIYFKLRDRARLTSYNPICNIIAADKERDASFGEELRKLYVALTRAKERLYITGCAEVGWEDLEFSPKSAKSWLDLMLYLNSLGEKSFFDLKKIAERNKDFVFIEAEKSKKIKPTSEMLDIVSFEYPYQTAVTTAAKISVSELREGLLEDDEYNRTQLSVPASRVAQKPKFALEESVSPTDIGTANHLFMQFCDFSLAENDVVAEANRLLTRRMITEQQFKMLDFKALEHFFESELYQQIKASKRVYREKRFSVRDVIAENSEPILVQGVIDCFFENPDGTFTVVDYKTDRVKNFDELISRHRIQLSCYKRAVERMTGKTVSRVLLYSFVLGETTDVV